MRVLRLLALAAAAVGWSGSDLAHAQVPRFQPAQPTISPWMGLYQRNTGALDNYHNFVRPEQELRSTLQQQNARMQQHSENLQGLHTQVRELEHPPMRATGTASVFMDTSHYYDTRTQGGSFRPSAATRLGANRPRPNPGR